ncbi:MAG: hypothetical protein GNW80_09285 [Asgard group archaeon]|nr:hypothetical protein [Asgard group archaeon]
MKNTSQMIVVIIIFFSLNIPAINGSRINIQIDFTEIGSIDTNGETMNVFLQGDIAFVLDTTDNNPGGLVIIDVSDPTNPVKLASLFDGGSAMELVVKDDLAFVADGPDGLEIINVSDLAHPEEIYQYPVNTYSSDVEIKDDLLFVANWDYGLEIFNVTNPESPVKLVRYNYNYLNCMQLDIKGDLACVTDHRNDYTSIRLLNISNPSSPQQLSTHIVAETDFWDPKIYENYIFVGNHYLNGGEIQILNITDPTNIVKVGEFDDGGNMHSISFNSSFAFIADYNRGVIALDLSDPVIPDKIGRYFDGGHAKKIFVKDNLLFVADREDGLEILQIETTTRTIPGFNYSLVFFSFIFIVILSLKKRTARPSRRSVGECINFQR